MLPKFMKKTCEFGEIIDKLRRQKPVVHHITNYVTAESCADIALAAGASPVMADEPEEVEEITCNADALVLNFGTFSFNKMISMEKAVIMAKEAGIPVILDPVGVMSSSMRLQFALKLLENRYISIVRGNFSECSALFNGEVDGYGVDNITEPTSQGEGLKLAKDAAAKFGCVFAVTGAVDSISNGKQGIVHERTAGQRDQSGTQSRSAGDSRRGYCSK